MVAGGVEGACSGLVFEMNKARGGGVASRGSIDDSAGNAVAPQKGNRLC